MPRTHKQRDREGFAASCACSLLCFRTPQTFNLQTTCLRHASQWHISHVEASSRTPQPSTSISVDKNIIDGIATSAPRAVNNPEFRRTDHGHPLQSMCSRDSVWHSVTVHEDFDAVPTLPPILHTCPRSPWKTTRTGPIERLQQSVSTSFDQSWKRH